VIEQLKGRDFGGNTLRIERSERKTHEHPRGGSDRRPAGGTAWPKASNKVVHSYTRQRRRPLDPRWAANSRS